MGTKKLLRKAMTLFRKKEVVASADPETFFSQDVAEMLINGTILNLPSRHPLLGMTKQQPYRDECISHAAKNYCRKYPGKPVYDIGANIGDSCVRISSYCSSPIYAIEPSDFFFPYLEQNAAKMPNPVHCIKAIVSSDPSPISGNLVHWGGTAYIDEFVHETSSISDLPTITMETISETPPSFIKCDTDGFDLKIISGGLGFLSANHCGLLFENTIRDHSDVEESNKILGALHEIGYSDFIVWDDPGRLMLHTKDIESLYQLNRYMYECWDGTSRFPERNAVRYICNFDILCIHRDDEELAEYIVEDHLRMVSSRRAQPD